MTVESKKSIWKKWRNLVGSAKRTLNFILLSGLGRLFDISGI